MLMQSAQRPALVWREETENKPRSLVVLCATQL